MCQSLLLVQVRKVGALIIKVKTVIIFGEYWLGEDLREPSEMQEMIYILIQVVITPMWKCVELLT